MDDDTKRNFSRQLDELTRQNFEAVARMGSISADMTVERYLIDNIVNQARDLAAARQSAMREVLSLIGPPQTPPPLPRVDEMDDFVGRIAARCSPYTNAEPHPSDPYDIGSWAAQRRAAE